MAIYFPRGFNSGEPVRVVDGVTVVLGKLAKQRVDLIVLSGHRGLLGNVTGPAAKEAGPVLRAAGLPASKAVRDLPAGGEGLHLLPPGGLGCRDLAFLERRTAPRTARALRDALASIGDRAVEIGAREIALGPVTPDERGAIAMRDAIRERMRSEQTELRWVLVVSSRAQFDAATGRK
jgi:hypothetical protein